MDEPNEDFCVFLSTEMRRANRAANADEGEGEDPDKIERLKEEVSRVRIIVERSTVKCTSTNLGHQRESKEQER